MPESRSDFTAPPDRCPVGPRRATPMDDSILDKPRVLVLDDEEACAKAVIRLLKRLGITDVIAPDGVKAALYQIENTQVDLIICDLHMPGCDGVEALRLFAEHRVECPIVIASGADPKVLKAVQELGQVRGLRVVGTLNKPYGVEELEAVLRAASEVVGPLSRRPVTVVGEAELSRAIEEGELRLHYQPQLRLSSCRLEGAEALVRWQHPERGLLYPDSFVPLAEQSGLIEPLTDWVLSEAIRRASSWRSEGIDIGVSVNLSVKTFGRLDLPDRVEEAVGRANINPERLTLEVTESGFGDRVDSLLDIATRLRLKGFPLSIDDFGTGFSSLAQLRRLPFTELKLDRSFVSRATTDPESRSLLESSVNLAKRLRLSTVAEGIETEDEWNLLIWMGVDLGQGYYMAQPMPGEDLARWHAGWQSKVA